MIHIAICDDEEVILNGMTEKIKKAFNEKKTESKVFSTSSSVELLSYLESNPIDVLFLDIDMPKINGMEIAQKLLNEELNTLLIFVTNQEALVYEAFRYHPFGFIRKNFFDSMLEEQVQTILEELAKRNDTFSFKTGEGIYRLKLSQIIYFESESNYVKIHSTEGEFRFRGTLTALQNQLSRNGFIRVHKGFLVNQEHIYSIQADEIKLSDGLMVPMSRLNKEAVKAKIMRYMRY